MVTQLDWQEMLQQSRTARQWYEDEKWLMDDEDVHEGTGELVAQGRTYPPSTSPIRPRFSFPDSRRFT